MFEVYVSYARADVESAARLAEGLRLQRLSVWWDADVYKGRKRSAEASERLAAASIVLCLWSHTSMHSERLEKEALAAGKKLFPLALRDFDWKDCPDSLWGVGAAIPRLQFSEFFFKWLGRILRRSLAERKNLEAFRNLAGTKSWKSDGRIHFAPKTLAQAYRGKATQLEMSAEFAARREAYFRAHTQWRKAADEYRERVRAMNIVHQDERIVLFPPRVRVKQDANVGAQRVQMRVAGARFAEPYYFKTLDPKRPAFKVISGSVGQEGVQQRGFNLRNVQKWLGFGSRIAAADESEARLEQFRREAVSEAMERAYAARSITDLDTAIAKGFSALSVGYVGIGAIAARAPEQRIERKPEHFDSARWLDVRSSSPIEQREAVRFIRAGRLRVENAFLTDVPSLQSSVCALDLDGGGRWRDPQQASNLRLLSRLYVSFGSYLHDPLAPRDIELSPRQRECLQWTAIGKSSRQIAEIFDYDTEDVVDHLNDACRRLGVTAPDQAVREAICRGLIEPPPGVC